MNVRLIAVLAAVLGVFSGMAQAANEAPLTITLGGTQHYFDSNRDVDNEILPSGALEWRLSDDWAAEFTYSGGDSESSIDGTDVDIDQWHLGGVYYTEPQGNLYPYLALGAGELSRGFQSGKESDIQANVGAGLRYYFTDHWSWRADARWLHAFDDSDNDLALTFGIAYSFAPPKGKRSAAAPVAVATAVAVAAPVDSDGDGVIDDDDLCPGTPAGAEVDSRGCEVVQEVVETASVELQVNFGFNSVEVTEQYMQDLGGLAEFLGQFEELQLEIEGHTDSVGDAGYNQVLSERRANAVKAVLANKFGIAESRMTAIGYGEAEPVETNDTEEGRAENRRVMATLSDTAGN